MNDEFNMSLRKFLKRLGVTGQQAIEAAVREAQERGSATESGAIPVRASIQIESLGLEHVIEGEIRLGEKS